MKILILVAFIVFSTVSFSQKKTRYVITAEANALMCPFLSPKLISLIEKNGGKSVVKTKELTLLFYCDEQNLLSEEKILEFVDNIGYDPRSFKVAMKLED